MKKFLNVCLTIFMVVLLGGIVYLFTQVIYVMQNPIDISMIQPSRYATEIYDSNGKLVTKLGVGVQKSTYISEVPEIVKNSFIAVEDKRFKKHFGVDIYRTVGAIGEYIINFGNSDYGGSTITQQLVKNATGASEKSINRKVREWFYAIRIERDYSKDDIITHYSNIVYMGRGIYGIADASKYYFEKDVSKLNVYEAAFLAGLVQSPETYIKDNELGNKRKDVVLSCMYEQGMIDAVNYEKAKKQQLTPKMQKKSDVQSYFVDAVINEFAEYISVKEKIAKEKAITQIYQNGYKIYSTMDLNVQNAIDSKYESMSLNGLQSGIAIISVDGKVLGISGGVGKKTGDLVFNRSTQLKRQTGSSIKPLSVYAPCFENGVIDNSYLMEDKPISFNGWSPKNYYSGFRGYMTIRKAVEISNNTIPVQLVDILGVSKSYNTLQEMKFNLPKDDMNLSALSLGGMTYGVSPLQMASGYQTLANSGVWCEPIFYTKIVDKKEQVVYNYNTQQDKKKIFSPETAYLITDLLKTVVNGSEGTARGVRAKYTIAAKTGTTTDNKDKWLCTYTPNYACATWYGYDTPKGVGYSSSNIAANTKAILDKITNGTKDFDVPENIGYVNICNNSWNVAGSNCTNVRKELVDTRRKIGSCTLCQYVPPVKNEEPVQSQVQQEDSEQMQSNVESDENIVPPEVPTEVPTEVPIVEVEE